MDLDAVRRIVAEDSGLCTVAVVRADGRPHTSLVNAGVLEHPVTGTPVAAYVTYGPVKLTALRARPATSLHWRAGWRWVAVEGNSEIIGPDDPRTASTSRRCCGRCSWPVAAPTTTGPSTTG